MAMVINTGGRSITTQICHRDKETQKMVIEKRFTFNPGSLVEVEDSELKILCKKEAFQEYIDEEILQTGKRAIKIHSKVSGEIEEADEKSKKKSKEKD